MAGGLSYRGTRNFLKKYYHFRWLSGGGVVFVLLWNLLIFSYQRTAFSSVVESAAKQIERRHGGENKHADADPWISAVLTAVLTDVLPKLLYPLAGLLADAKLGRYRVMKYSVLLMWGGALLLTVVSILRYKLQFRYENVFFPLLVIIYFTNVLGTAGYHSNVIPFGIDQMPGCSGEQISGFIHWYYWTRNCNFGLIFQFTLQSLHMYCNKAARKGEFRETREQLNLYILLVHITFLTAAVCLDFLFSSSSKLDKDPKIHNPIKKLKDISTFIVKHKHPVGHRKAITFTYQAPPVRSDFAKQLYGGPFEDDEVEGVTAFWRILSFLLAAGFGAYIMKSGNFSYSVFYEVMKNSTSKLPSCTSKFMVTSFVNAITITFCIPIFEFLIYPLFRKYIPRMVIRIGLGMFVMLLGYTILLSINVAGHDLTDSTAGADSCMFYTESHYNINVSTNFLIPIIAIVTIGEMLFYIGCFEFICAQSPYNMRGFIIGIFFMISGLQGGLTSIVIAVFALVFNRLKSHTLGCGTWYMIVTMSIGLFGFILYTVAAKWYRRRQRGGQRDFNSQTEVESYYEK